MAISSNSETNDELFGGDFEDEDIVLEGSPLDEYVKNLYQKFENSEHEIDMFMKNSSHRSTFGNSIVSNITSAWNSVQGKIKHFFPVSKEIFSALGHSYFKEYGKMILKSSVIFEEHVDKLCFQAPQEFLLIAKTAEDTVTDVCETKSGKSSFLLLLSIFVAICLLYPFLPAFLYFFMVLLVGVVLLFNVLLQISLLMLRCKHISNLNALQHLLKSSEQLNAIIKLILQLIRELEVISMGYTLVNGKEPFLNLRSKLIGQRTLPNLRLLLLHSMSQCEAIFKSHSQVLLKNNQSFDNKLFSNHSFPQKHPTNHFDLDDDKCSLASLKSCFLIFSHLRSEFLTQLFFALSFSLKNLSHNGGLLNLAKLLVEPCKVTDDNLVLLNDSYRAHKSVDLTVLPSQNTRQSNSVSALRINLRSLEVHLRAALYKLMELNNAVEDEIDEGQLLNVENQLEVGRECLNRCKHELCATSDKTDTKLPLLIKHPPANIDSETIENCSLKSGDDDDDDMEDKIFEAVSENEPIEITRGDFCHESDFVEEQVRQESAVVIRELQSVLSVVSSEEQRDLRKRHLFPSYHSRTCANAAIPQEDITIQELLKIAKESDHVRDNDSCLSAEGIAKEVNFPLKYHKKPCPPGRAPSQNFRHVLKQERNSQSCLETHTQSGSHNVDKNEDKNQPSAEWSDGLGIGFSTEMAKQVVNLVKMRAVNSSLVGDVSDESVAEEES